VQYRATSGSGQDIQGKSWLEAIFSKTCSPVLTLDLSNFEEKKGIASDL